MIPDDAPAAARTPDAVDIPDWHCVHHGEMGDGPFACKGCADYWG